jgi:hypothetical protein
MKLQTFYSRAGVRDKVARVGDIVLHPEMRPEKHQIMTLNQALYYGTWGVYDEMGTGKTFPAQAWAIYWAAEGARTICLMPPVLIPQFKASLLRTFQGIERVLSIHELTEGPLPSLALKKKVQAVRMALRENNLRPFPRALVDRVARYEGRGDLAFEQADIDRIRNSTSSAQEWAKTLGCSVNTIQTIRRGKTRDDLFRTWTQTDSWPEIMLMTPEIYRKVGEDLHPHYGALLADEAHGYLCHTSNQVWKLVHQFSNLEGRYVLPMTGTPLFNLPTALYALIKITNPEAYSSYRRFESFHCEQVKLYDNDKDRVYWKTTGYRNLDVLKNALFARGSRVVKEDVFTLPEPRVITTDLRLSKEHVDLYRKLVRERVLQVNGQEISAIEANSLRQKLLQIATVPDPFTDRPIKNNQFKEMLKELLEDVGCLHHEKVLVFAIYNKTIEAMAEWFSAYNPALIYGGSNTKKNVEKFLNDDSCRLALAHYQSGGVGLNLQDVCRYVICAESTTIPGAFTQATSRVYRKGQKKVVTFYVLRVLGTGWVAQVDSMMGKMQLSESTVFTKDKLLAELLGQQ